MKREVRYPVRKRYSRGKKSPGDGGNQETSPAIAPEKKTVLFLCTYNSVRSQIAEGMMRAMYPGAFDAYSAGIAPAGIHPLAIMTLQEIGIDITARKSKSFREYRDREFDFVVTLSTEVRAALDMNILRARVYLDRPVRSPVDIYEDEDAALSEFRELRERIRLILAELAEYEPGEKPGKTHYRSPGMGNRSTQPYDRYGEEPVP